MVIPTHGQGIPPIRITRSLVDRLLKLLGDRASLMGEDSDAGPLSLSLIEEAPSHDALREHSVRTRRLFDWIEGVGVFYGDTLPGPGAVHFDYQPGNVLVHSNRPDELTAIVDWGGAVASAGGFDLVRGENVNTIDAKWRNLGRCPHGTFAAVRSGRHPPSLPG